MHSDKPKINSVLYNEVVRIIIIRHTVTAVIISRNVSY